MHLRPGDSLHVVLCSGAAVVARGAGLDLGGGGEIVAGGGRQTEWILGQRQL